MTVGYYSKPNYQITQIKHRKSLLHNKHSTSIFSCRFFPKRLTISNLYFEGHNRKWFWLASLVSGSLQAVEKSLLNRSQLESESWRGESEEK